jgi:hypothetical protein
MRRSLLLTSLLVLGSFIVGATAFHDQFASAGASKKATGMAGPPVTPVVFTDGSGASVGNKVRIDPASNGVTESNIDANGDIKVHEQGTANVNVTNSSLPLASPAPVDNGGGGNVFDASIDIVTLPQTEIVTGLVIHMTAGVDDVSLLAPNNPTVTAKFMGPASHGSADIALALARPMTFNRIQCAGSTGNFCTISWIGNEP